MNRDGSLVNREARLKRLLLCAVTVSVCLAQPAYAFKITEPAAGTTLASGQTVTAHVDLGNDIGIVKVRYYWYRERDEALVQQEETDSGSSKSEAKISVDKFLQKDSVVGGSVVSLPVLVSTGDMDPAFGGPLKVPPEAIGPMRLLAVADISRGRLGTRTVFDEIIVHTEPPAELQHIDFETDKPLLLGREGQSATYGQVDVLGKIFELPVVGDFADGVSRPLTTPSSGTTYQSSNDKVIEVLPDGMLKIVGNGKTVLTVKNRGQQATLDVHVSVGDEPNEPPVAVAGENRTVKSGTKVELNGLRSHDPEGEALFYSWSQVRGAKVPLLDLNMPRASFLAPFVSEPKLFRFRLRVTDKKGADSMPSFVDVSVEP
jgi:hypothetical protein